MDPGQRGVDLCDADFTPLLLAYTGVFGYKNYERPRPHGFTKPGLSPNPRPPKRFQNLLLQQNLEAASSFFSWDDRKTPL